MGKIIVLGIGNRLMMDDGIGLYLVEELSKLNRSLPVSFIIGESDIDYCMEEMMGSTFAIIVDAVFSGNKPGELAVYSIADLHEQHTLDISAHNFHLFQSLFQQRDTMKGYLIGIDPHEVRFHIGLSSILKEKWETILQEVSQTIDRLIAKG
ncbi:hydrogenase maturation protease [Rossellomorea aquimaris]|uniref:Hydrogenase maturation protease n=1 Tax=Rossellomorea aquimaris TaxID=189382 RepID=A0A1J6W1N0_9BACI|nr:hydrogenase maturation protease [Rossellomorea aquimaris]OIU70492.1 hydrogenase maturation protease [Rossellomorea aquimaris]